MSVTSRAIGYALRPRLLTQQPKCSRLASGSGKRTVVPSTP